MMNNDYMFPPNQSNGYNTNFNNQYGGGRVTKKDIIEWLRCFFNAQEIVQVDEFESVRTRHVCPNGKQIFLLDKIIQPVPTVNGPVFAEVFFCQCCGKLIINKSSIEIL